MESALASIEKTTEASARSEIGEIAPIGAVAIVTPRSVAKIAVELPALSRQRTHHHCAIAVLGGWHRFLILDPWPVRET